MGAACAMSATPADKRYPKTKKNKRGKTENGIMQNEKGASRFIPDYFDVQIATQKKRDRHEAMFYTPVRHFDGHASGDLLTRPRYERLS